MSEVVSPVLPYPTDELLCQTQQAMLALLRSLNFQSEAVGSPSTRIFEHKAEAGSLLVNRVSDTLHVRASGPVAQTSEGYDILPVRLEMKYLAGVVGQIVPAPLFNPLSYVLFMQAENAHFSSRYVPYRWRDGGTSLESDRYGTLPPRDLLRVQAVVGSIAASATVEDRIKTHAA